MGIVGEVVIARRASTPMRDTAAVLLDVSDAELEREVRVHVEQGDARITDFHIWRVGPEAHVTIVSVTGPVDTETVRARIPPVHEFANLTVERCEADERQPSLS